MTRGRCHTCMDFSFTFQTFWVALLLLTSFMSGRCDGSDYDWRRGNISLAHSANSYCDPSTYLLRKFKGDYLAGFVVMHAISDPFYDVEGYVGYDVVDQAIYTVFRGSSSLPNYWADAITELVPYSLCENCLIHDGFSLAEESVASSSLMSVLSDLHRLFPTFSAVFTGHSLGGALATLLAVRVRHENIFPAEAVQLFTFGSPRVGNGAFALYASDKILTSYRVTHHQDVIPHLPPVFFGFMHIANEWYQPGDSAELHHCVSFIPSTAGHEQLKRIFQEDGNCSAQWPFYETSSADHLVYLANPLGAESCSLYAPLGVDFVYYNSSVRMNAAHTVFLTTLSLNQEINKQEVLPSLHSFNLTMWILITFSCLLTIPVFIFYLCFSSHRTHSLHSAHNYIIIEPTECAKRDEYLALMNENFDNIYQRQ